MYVKEGTARLDGGWTRPRGGVKGGRLALVIKNGGSGFCISAASNGVGGRLRITVTSARTATASLVDRRDAGGAAERLRLDAPARGRARCRRDRHARRDPRRAGWWSATITWREEAFGRPARVDAVEYDGYPDAEPLLSLEEETWRQVTLGTGSAAPNTSGEASDGEKSDGGAGDSLPSSATDVGGAVATGGEGSGVERGGGSSRDGLH